MFAPGVADLPWPRKPRYPNNNEITYLKQQAAHRLRSAVQFFDPFKFVTYTELIAKSKRVSLRSY